MAAPTTGSAAPPSVATTSISPRRSSRPPSSRPWPPNSMPMWWPPRSLRRAGAWRRVHDTGPSADSRWNTSSASSAPVSSGWPKRLPTVASRTAHRTRCSTRSAPSKRAGSPWRRTSRTCASRSPAARRKQRLDHQLRHRAADVRSLLLRRLPQGRTVLRALLVDRMTFTPFVTAGIRGYRFVGHGSYGGLLAGTTWPTTIGGPNGIRTLYHSIARSRRSHWERHSNPVRSSTEHGAAPQWARPWWKVLWGIARQAPVQGATRHHGAAGGGKEARCLRLRTRCTSALIGALSLTRSPCSTPSECYWANAPRLPVPVVRCDAPAGPVSWRPASLPSFLDISHVSCFPTCFGSPIPYRTAFY